jgi:threonine/homoserine/homoserine lactone efflux protein
VDSSYWAFLGVSMLVIMTPGPDTALTIRNTVLAGRRGGVFTALGVSVGQLIWAVTTSLGMVALLLASEQVFHIVKLAGAGYLIYLGAVSLHAAFSSGSPPAHAVDRTRRALRPRAALRQGVLNNLGNPKMAVFFASVLPQFAPEGHGSLSAVLLLGVIFSALTCAWLCLYAATVSALGPVLARSRVRRAVDGLAGAVLIGLGVRVTTEAR